MTILLVSGMTLLLAGCAVMETATALMTAGAPESNPGCPPTVPALPAANEDGVWLESSDMTELLIYFEEVKECQR